MNKGGNGMEVKCTTGVHSVIDLKKLTQKQKKDIEAKLNKINKELDLLESLHAPDDEVKDIRNEMRKELDAMYERAETVGKQLAEKYVGWRFWRKPGFVWLYRDMIEDRVEFGSRNVYIYKTLQLHNFKFKVDTRTHLEEFYLKTLKQIDVYNNFMNEWDAEATRIRDLSCMKRELERMLESAKLSAVTDAHMDYNLFKQLMETEV
jgi:uncharacterized membrane protein YgaE (UPF0421/DUF939 family)